MNRDEAEKVLRIMAWADDGCPYCASKLFKRFIETFPEYRELAEKIFREIYEDDLWEFLEWARGHITP